MLRWFLMSVNTEEMKQFVNKCAKLESRDIPAMSNAWTHSGLSFLQAMWSGVLPSSLQTLRAGQSGVPSGLRV